MKNEENDDWFRVLLFIIIVIILAGCTHAKSSLVKSDRRAQTNSVAIAEEASANNKAAKDALDLAPTNAPVVLAKRFLDRNLQLLGLPLHQFDVTAILAEHRDALENLTERFERQQRMLDDRAKIKAENDTLREELVEMGKKYEMERNKTIVKRIWHWAIGTLGVGGLVAFCVLCPAVIPIMGSMVAWIVGAIPKIAGFFGVVGKKAFDGVVVGVQNFKAHLKKEPDRDLHAGGG